MKTINTYINEKLLLTSKQKYTCQPKDCDELRSIIKRRIKEDGNTCDLNDIDVSEITNMGYLFDESYYGPLKDFNGDISLWDVSNVKNMDALFYKCYKFNCDLSKWDVSKVERMTGMFYDCEQFNSDISHWDVSNVKRMSWMFSGCKKFKQDLDSWDVSNVKYMECAFEDCPTTPTWYDRKQYDK